MLQFECAALCVDNIKEFCCLQRKHDVFFKTLTWVTTPVSLEYVTFAKNWLTQHIKNTDFKYKYKLATQHKTPEPYVWNTEFAVKVFSM